MRGDWSRMIGLILARGIFFEPHLDQRKEGGDGFLGVRSGRFELERGATLGAQEHQVQDTPTVGQEAMAGDLDLSLELLSNQDQPSGCPEMEPGPVGQLHASSHGIPQSGRSLVAAHIPPEGKSCFPPARARHSCVAHARSPLPKNPPELPLCKGGTENGLFPISIPPLRRGVPGGVNSRHPGVCAIQLLSALVLLR
jgi:hypothetical protein